MNNSFTITNYFKLPGVLAQATTDSRREFVWTGMPAGISLILMVIAMIAIIYGVFYLYRREISTASMATKLFLASLRAAVLVTLAVIFLGPSMIEVRTRTVHPNITVLRDASLSMATADRYSESTAAAAPSAVMGKSAEEIIKERPTREAIVNSAIAKGDNAFLKALAEKGRVQVIDFAQQSANVVSINALAGSEKDIEKNPFPVIPPVKAEGRGTDITDTLREALQANNPSAIILISDGQETSGDDPTEVAREALAKQVPIYVVGIGDASRPRDLRVANVYVRPQIWSEEPFEIEAVVVGQGLESDPNGLDLNAKVELIEKRVSESDGSLSAGSVVERKDVKLPPGGGRVTCQFSHTVKEIGKYVYSVRVEPLEDEISEQDNQVDSQQVKVLSREKVRVLLVAGAPTWEFRMVEKLLQREKTMVVSCWLQTLDEGRAQEGTKPITHLPITKDELFWYDVVVLLDPNPREFDKEWIELLKQFTGDHAGGLMFMAGPKYTEGLLTSSRTTEFRDLLPVLFGDVGAMAVSELLQTNSQSWPLRVAPAAMDHQVMTFFSDREQSLERWKSLPGIYWSFPSTGVKPTAQLLVEHSDPTLRSVEGSRPLMVSGRYGAGHVLYLGFNGTWRWRKAGSQAEFFDKFWIQSIRFLVEGRSLEGRRRGSVQTNRDRYELGEKVTFTARLQNTSYEPLVAEKIEASLQVEGQPPLPVNLMPLASQPGSYEATFIPRQPGQHKLQLRIPGASSDEALIDAPFQVELPSVETSQVWLNKPLLTNIAKLSKDGGYFEINELDKIAALVPNKTESIDIRSQPNPLWDIPEVLYVLVGMLAVEWFVRKRNKLL